MFFQRFLLLLVEIKTACDDLPQAKALIVRSFFAYEDDWNE